MDSRNDTRCRVGCPIRISTDQSLLAAPRGFSQRATSFIASWCQGIHRMPLSYSDPDFPPPKWGQTTMHGNHRQRRTRGEPRSSLMIVPFGSQSIISAQNPDVARPLRRTGFFWINTHNDSEPSLSDLGARARPRTPKQGLRHTRHTLPVRHQPDNGTNTAHNTASIARAQRRTRT